MIKKYIIDYGGGVAILHTPFPVKERFYTLANSCFGIKNYISSFDILKIEDVPDYKYFETLEFEGKLLAWNEYGARKIDKVIDRKVNNYIINKILLGDNKILVSETS